MRVLGSYEEADKYQQQAINLYTSLCEESGDFAPLASAKLTYGNVLSGAGRFQEAADAFRETAMRLCSERVPLMSDMPESQCHQSGSGGRRHRLFPGV